MTINSVKQNLLTSNNIHKENIYDVLNKMSDSKIEYGDIYIQSILQESWLLENGIIKTGSYHEDHGIGIRAINGSKTGFSYSNDINVDSLFKISKMACDSIYDKNYVNNKIINFNNVITSNKYNFINPLRGNTSEEKIDILNIINNVARKADKRVVDVNARILSNYENIFVSSTDGNLSYDIRPLIHVYISVFVEENGKREQGFMGGGRRDGYKFFMEKNNLGETNIIYWTLEAVRSALLNLYAIPAPSGSYAVVLGSGWPGVLLHEAVGHGLEGDFNRHGTSLFSNKIGKKVASSLCTIIDDGTIFGRRGSLTIDDEGTPSQKNILIENGILKCYMQDKLNAKFMDTKSTGNCRRESYAHLPMPRMTNTYMLPGLSNKDEIIESVGFGLYATNFSGGQVDITSGQFVFSTSEAYLIKNGKITNPIKNATLIGSGIEVMQQISMVGNDLSLDSGIGICIKDGQSIPVGVGQPTIKLNNLTIGGTN
ncbi:metalloprotease TldD [Buchnera aphidicola (Neophyllaphis varicolor)]|uniref:metalloprotease TldD n=1 Tax=Buchnera aphidicola TaxID=9 RepID=UPI0031B84EBC